MPNPHKMVAPLGRLSIGFKTVHDTTKFLHCRNAVSVWHAQSRESSNLLASRHLLGKEDVVEVTKRIWDYLLKGHVDYARKMFDEMTERDAVSWNVMIRGYIENHRVRDARELFDKMAERNSVSWNSMITGYAMEGKTNVALKFFLVMPCKDGASWTAMISGLLRASKIQDAWNLFKQMPEPNSITWSSVISGFQQNGLPMKTLDLFKDMLVQGVQPTAHSLCSAMTASADLAVFAVSQQLYSHVLKRGFHNNTHIGNSAITMFMKSGSSHNARCVFMDSLHCPDLVTWNSMIIGYGRHGYGMEAIIAFHQMQKAQFLPDRISFLGVLQGCSHCGFIEEGKKYFHSMEKDYGISPGPEHYSCMVDLFSRSGMLKEAAEIILKIPFELTPIFWRTMLNGCRIWGDLKLGVFAAAQVSKLEPYNSSACLMVADIHARAERWKEVWEMREQMREGDVKKELGYSWVEIKESISLFASRDETHPKSDHIYATIELLYYDIAEHSELNHTDLETQLC